MKTYSLQGMTGLAAAIALGFTAAAHAVTLVTNTIFEQNFDSDTVGALPSGWSGASTDNAVVTDSLSLSAPNSFQLSTLSSNGFTVQRAFAAHNLASGDPDNRLSYSVDINVDFIDQNDSEGFRFRIWNGTSQIDVGTPRVLRNGANWRFFNGLFSLNGGPAYVGNFNFDQWYNFRVVITPTTISSGTAHWYMDNVLVNTETYSGRSPISQTSNLDVFDIFQVSDGNPATAARMYIDNLQIQAILPEPSSLALLLAGAAMLLRRRGGA
jgi:hypothetical protein